MQKSRVEAIRNGDRNTHYFHRSVIIRRKFNRIEALQNDDREWVTEPDESPDATQELVEEQVPFLSGASHLNLFNYLCYSLICHAKQPDYLGQHVTTSIEKSVVFYGGDGVGEGNPLSFVGFGHALQGLRWTWAPNDESFECSLGDIFSTLTRLLPPQPWHSNAWKGVWEQRQHITASTGMALGDGRSTRFWLYVPLSELEKTVHEYWDERGGWKWDDFSDFLPHPILARIASFELLEEGMSDNFYWINGKNGSFTLQYAISIIQEEPATVTEESWGWVWKAHTP
ncbi:hypothetical protein Cgig2_004987 [Carnegiea gigantea]|uniref:Uncharacterized protein n=1 Tax=Carnegiea gigantea TaxID=171969 RepID=A0A9Q1KXJ2_9CARY|nr:hypothetical protein Cgig2_004987 [Carnegiea gigantea]